MSHSISSFPNHCGSRVFHGFIQGATSDYKDLFSKSYYKTAFAIFTDRDDQRRAYKALKRKFKILYQSPVLEPLAAYQQPYFIVIYLNEKP